MKIIGLTGGIGSGKSTILEFFKELGAAIFIADNEAKKLMHNDIGLKTEIIEKFGEQSYNSENELNRAYISSIVFSDKEKLKALNNLVHPRVRKQFLQFLAETNSNFVVYEAAILFESGNDKNCDFVVTVIADFEDRMHRIVNRDGVSKDIVLERMKNQSSDDFKIKKSHFVIYNKQLAVAKEQVKTVFKLIQKSNSN